MSLLMIEAFYGGSHKQMVDLLCEKLNDVVQYTLPATKWHWRARTAALYFSQAIPPDEHYKVLFTSSVLNLSELLALRPDLSRLRTVLYFHENQLLYPVRKHQDRDFQYGYNQVLSCLVADHVVFNSAYNRDSFLDNVSSFLRLIPDHRPVGIADQIRPKCHVLYFPLVFPSRMSPRHNCATHDDHPCDTPASPCHDCDTHSDHPCDTPASPRHDCDTHNDHPCVTPATVDSKPLHIVWAHRWEHDKDPETFFGILFQLRDEGLHFRVSVIGESHSEVPEIFTEAKSKLCEHIQTWGFQESKGDYSHVLKCADVAVSTALHEFFGVAMLEAVYYGCYPLCPQRLVYPEFFPQACLYRTPTQLYKRLRDFCRKPHLARSCRPPIDLSKFQWENLQEKYQRLLQY